MIDHETYFISSECYNKILQALMKCKDIRHFSTSGDTKASVIQQFSHTLKKCMYHYVTVKNRLSFLPVLKDLVTGCNRAYHQTIKIAPEKAAMDNEEQVWKNFYAKTSKLKVGHCVRLNKKYQVLKKGYLHRWTEKVFVVARVVQGPYLQDPGMGRYTSRRYVFQRGFTEGRCEQRRSVTGREDRQMQRDKVLVCWKGWPDKYDTWMEKRTLVKMS